MRAQNWGVDIEHARAVTGIDERESKGIDDLSIMEVHASREPEAPPVSVGVEQLMAGQ